ncbi:Chaperone protein DnaJ [Trichinella pseudospiralis]
MLDLLIQYVVMTMNTVDKIDKEMLVEFQVLQSFPVSALHQDSHYEQNGDVCPLTYQTVELAGGHWSKQGCVL